MRNDEIVKKMQQIASEYPDNLAAQYFDAEWYLQLPTEQQGRFSKIIATCLANPDSEMGCYAMYGDDYDLFNDFFANVIRDYHHIERPRKITQPHDWGLDQHCDLSVIEPEFHKLSMRVRVARNHARYPLPGAMTKEQRVELENEMIGVFKSLIADPEYGGCYLSLTPNSPYEITEETYQERIQAHQMFKNMSGDPYLDAANISGDWPYGRGMYISADEDFIIWVGEEDHFRIMAMRRGTTLNKLFGRLKNGLDKIEEALGGFAHSDKFGYVTSCPTNLGTGMRASLHIKLPNLCAAGLPTLKRKAKALKLSVRGAGGEHSDPGKGGLVDISPKARLGVAEVNIMQKLFDGIDALWQAEKAL